ncbi:MAG: protein kinase [Bryobacteraceae bacterium]
MRYERKQVLGEGGMGVVYLAWDADLRREVALKTIRDSRDPGALELFRKECAVLSSLNHPNIVDIYDIGEIEEGRARVPYFVMPLLPGVTLDKLIKDEPQRLTVERVVEIISQACRGLQAAHERGLVHRDLKPSNIFVLGDDSVKIIDFGVAHLVDHQTSIGIKGTLYYMAPEQLEMKPATPACDIFALGVVSFEALTRRRPFTGSTRDEVVQAILKAIPPPASDLNPAVSQAVSQIVHAAMAKQPFHRFSNIREFGESLQKALHGQPIDRFDPSRIQPRLARVDRALSTGDPDYASEILSQLEAEGHLHPEIRPLRRTVDQALRDRASSQLIESARRRLDEGEYQLALQKIQEVLEVDPQNAKAAAMRAEIEGQRSAEQVQAWLNIARQHLENLAFGPARDAARNVLQANPASAEASQLMAEIDLEEQDYARLRKEKEENYQRALSSWHRGDITAALGRIEKVLEIDRRSPETMTPDRSAGYQEFYNKIRSEHDAIKRSYEEACKHVEGGNFAAASAICDHYLQQYPDHALFQSLRVDMGERQRQNLSADIAAIARSVEAEPDLDRKVRMLEEAREKHPHEEHFDMALKSARQKRDLVNSIVAKARAFEDQGHFSEALSQWDILRNIHGQYPGIEFEYDRVQKRLEQQSRTESRARWAEQIDAAILAGDPARAGSLAKSALAEYPGDAELIALEKLASQGMQRSAEAQKLVEEARTHATTGNLEQSVDILRAARRVDPAGKMPRAALVDSLFKLASEKLETDWSKADELLTEASSIDPDHPQARSLTALIADRKRDSVVETHIARAREKQAAGDIAGAVAEVARGLSTYPLEARLTRLRASLERTTGEHKVPAAVPPPTSPPALREEAETIAVPFPPRVKPHSVPPPAPPPTQPAPAAKAPPVPPPPANRGTLPPASAPPAQARPTAPPPAKKPFPLIWLAPLALIPVAGAVLWFALGSRQPAEIPPSPPPLTDPEPAPLPPDGFDVVFNVTPAEAKLQIGEQDLGSGRQARLPAGTYEVVASADGFEPASFSIVAGPGSPPPEPVELKPAPTLVELSIGSGQAVFDGRTLRTVNGRASFTVGPGGHRVEISNALGKAAFQVRTATASIPVVEGFRSQGAFGAVVATYKDAATIHGPATAVFGGRSVNVPSGGLSLPGLPAGRQAATVSDGKERRQVGWEIRPAPGIYIYLMAPGLVDFLITSNEDGATVTVNGKPAGETAAGQLALQLTPGAYTVRVSKPGWGDSGDRKIDVRPGMRAEAFPLSPQMASLAITNAPPGAQVLVDGRPVGEVGSNGAFSQKVNPGSHTVGLRAPGQISKDLSRGFAAGQTIAVNARDLLTSAPTAGFVQLTLATPNANVTFSGGGERNKPVRPGRIQLPPGDYEFQAIAPGMPARRFPVTVRAGQTQDLEIRLGRDAPSLNPVSGDAALNAMEGGNWQEKDGWSTLGDLQSRYIALDGPAVVSFTVQGRGKTLGVFGGRREVRFMAAWRDSRNYVLFEMGDNLECKEVVNGKTENRGKVPLPKDAENVRITIRPTRIEVAVEGKTATFDAARFKSTSFLPGKFGFRGPIGIQKYSVQPAR